jgi:2,3-bisphosphoglycerate-independent phosphoglycerate mutase
VLYVHVKGSDEFGHDGDFEGKRKSIEDIDAALFAALASVESKLLCVAADRSKPCVTEGRTDDRVSILITGSAMSPNGSSRFTESHAHQGTLGPTEREYVTLRMLKQIG